MLPTIRALPRFVVVLVLLPASAMPVAAPAAPPPLPDRALAATCAACHGTEGRASTGAPVPGLAGMERERLRDAMQAFRRGTRNGTVMPQIAKGYDDDEIDRLAAYFAATRP